jgi:hypothetical protein
MVSVIFKQNEPEEIACQEDETSMLRRRMDDTTLNNIVIVRAICKPFLKTIIYFMARPYLFF